MIMPLFTYTNKSSRKFQQLYECIVLDQIHHFAGKSRSGKTRKGNKPLGAALTQAAQAAAHTKDTYLSSLVHRSIAGPRGKKRAIVAVAHSVLVMAYYMIVRKESYKELGGNYFDKRDAEKVMNRLVGRLEKLGYAVSLQQSSAPATA